jgi:autotransporter-associated beta strand protein
MDRKPSSVISRWCCWPVVGTLLTCLAGLPLPASAQTWTGATSTAWTLGANWDGGVAPTTTGTAVFGSLIPSNQPILTTATVGSLQFLKSDGGWNITTSGSLVLNTTSGSTVIDDSLNTSGITTITGRIYLPNVLSNWIVGNGGLVRVTDVVRFVPGTNASRSFNIASGTVSVNGYITNSLNTVFKSGPGTLMITGSSTQAGSQFDLREGTLIVGDRNALGSSGILLFLGGATLQASVDLTGTNAVTKTVRFDPGTVTISGSRSIEFPSAVMGSRNGSISVANNLTDGKTLTLGQVAGGGFSPNAGASIYTFTGSGLTIISGSMTNGSGATNFAKAGSGTLTLQGIGTYTGSMSVQAGVLKLENAAALGTTAPLTVSGGTLDLGGLTVTKTGTIGFSGGTTANGTLVNDTVAYAVTQGTVAANLAGTVGLTKTGAGVAILSGTNSYGGVTTISAGMLQFATRSALYGGTSALWTAANLNTSGTLAVNVGGSGEFDTGDVTTLLTNLGGTGGAVNNNGLRAGSRIGFDTTNAAGSTFTSTNSIANSTGTGGGAIGLVKLGSGTLVLSGSSSYTGGTIVNAGVLRLGNANAIGSGSITINGGILDLNSYSGSSATLSLGGVATQTGFTGGGTLTLGGTVNYTASPAGAVIQPTLVLGGSSRTFAVGGSGVGSDALTVSGLISSTSGLIKTGTGRLVLSNSASTYSGKTTIQSGVLEVSSLSGTGVASSLGAPTTAANARIDLGTGTTLGTLQYTGTGGHSTNRPIFLAGSAGGGGILDASGSGPVSFTGGVTGVAGTTLTLTGSNTGVNSITAVTGSNVTKTGAGTWVLGSNSFTGRLTIEQGTIVAASNAPGGSGTSSSLGKENGPTPLIGLVNGSGTAALLAANGVTISRVIEVAALGSGDQEVVLGGSGAGEATFDGNSAFRLGRGVTLAADPGGNVRFSTPTANWQQQDGSSDPAVAVTIGTPTATGTVTLETQLPGSITAVNVRQGTLRLAVSSTFGSATPVTVGSAADSATLDLAGLGQTVQSLAFGGTAGLVVPGGGGGVLRLGGASPTVTVASGSGHRIDSTVALDSAATFAVSDAAARMTAGGVITDGVSGAQGLAKSGSGTLVLAALNTYTGTTSIAGGAILVSGSGRIASSARIDVATGGRLEFARTDDYGGAYDGKLTGSGLLSVQSGSLTLTGLNTFAGSSQVLSGAVLQLDGQINNTTLDVASGATLMGSGTILGTTTIAGLHRPGNSPGIQTLGNLTYTSGASVQWELWNNTILNNTTPPDYDQIVLTGNLDFAGSTAFNLVFTGSSGPTNFSEVAWNNSFWDTDREWLVYDVAGTTTGFGNLALVQTNWLDSTGAAFNTSRSMASFRLEKRPSNDVYLVYSSIPEPSTLALAGIGLAAAAWAARRRMAQTHVR